jgi:hypothetical protein
VNVFPRKFIAPAGNSGRWLILGWAFLLAGQLSADPVAPVIQSDGLGRFILYRYPLSKQNEARINFIIGDLLKRHEQTFHFTTDTNFHIQIRIFGRFKDYEEFASTNLGQFDNEHLSLTNLAGYYSLSDDEVVTWRQRDPTYLANNILHECSHAIMHHEFRVLPIWLDEGCAVYFSFPVYMRSKNAELRLQYQWFELKKWLDKKSLPDLRTFLDLTPEQFRVLDPDKTYPISWSLFQLLMSTPQNRDAMNETIAAFQRPGSTPPDCAKLLDETYPGGLSKMQRDWYVWIASGATNVLKTAPQFVN